MAASTRCLNNETKFKLRKAIYTDIPACLEVLDQGRQSQREAGFVQWLDGYPSEGNVRNDIDSGMAHVLMTDDGSIAGYIAIAYDDTEYERLFEIWTPVEKYAVFHRLAVAKPFSHQGIGALLFGLSEDLVLKNGAWSVRIDTGGQNKPMQRLLESRNYISLGTWEFSWGTRLAYEKVF